MAKSVIDGGKKIFQWVTRPERFGEQPDTIEAPDTQLTRIEKEWKDIWSRDAPNGKLAPDARRLPPITVEGIRSACKSFPTVTAVGLDRIRPRPLLLLGEAGLELLAALYNFSELSGQVSVLGAHVDFLPKPAGGERPIGILPTLYRVWCRCRRRIADK